jgi:D-alanyl-D-alanine carboxypeptidase
MMVLLSALAAAIIAPPAARADIGSYIVVDLSSGAVLDQDNPFQPWYPASITKLMTAYVTFRALREGRVRPTSPVTITKRAAAQAPSKMGFKVGTVITVDTALKIIIVKSANDIAVALGEAVGGSEAAFVAEMNATARRLGMTTTRFVNPHGLPADGQLTSARDMAVLARTILTEFPEHRGLFQITALQLGKKLIPTHNRLLERFRGVDGMKTGFICNSGFNMVATATRGGRTLVAVVLGAYTAAERNEFAAMLFTKNFDRGGGTRLASLAVPASPGPPAVRRQFVCGPNRAKTPKQPELVEDEVEQQIVGKSGSRLVIAGASTGQAKPKKRTSYLEPRFSTMKPVVIKLGGADMNAAAAPSPFATAVAAEPELSPAEAAVLSQASGTPQRGAVPLPSARPAIATVTPDAAAPVAPAGDVPAADAAVAQPDQPSIASAAQPGLSIPLSLFPKANAATMSPADLAPAFERTTSSSR